MAYKRWIIGGLIVLCLTLLVWFAGPLLPLGSWHPFDPVSSRLVTIVLLVLAWLGWEFFRVWRVRRKSQQLVDQLTQEGTDAAASEAEAAALHQRFTEAMAVLKNGRFGNQSGPAALYSLPWYMFIGAPGSGKTTALLNSGLRFPLSKAGASVELSGVGGTRNCDWLFSDQAVLIDTAGRYTTHDSNARVDTSAWKTFLGLLKKFRPRQPINGILVTLSVQDLLTFDSRERLRYGQIVRERIEELQQELGLEFPVYILVTKVDLVSGFSEFFATFDADQRAQVWGATFALDLKTRVAENARQGFDKAFPSLLGKVNELLFQRLQEERDADRRAVMYPFPQQLAALGPLISEFLGSAFGDGSQPGQPLVRGVYFTSGTQQGAPIDRLLGSLTRSLNLSGRGARAAAPAGAAKAYFITRLLKEVVFPEASLAGFSERRETLLRRISWAAFAVAALFTAGFLSVESLSYMRNRDALAAALPASTRAAEALVAVGAPGGDDLAQLVAALGAIQAVPASITEDIKRPPWSMTWGLYQGHAVATQSEQRYLSALQQGLLPRVAIQLEQVMASPQTRTEKAYDALKAYIMLYEPKRMQSKWFVEAVSDVWSNLYPRSLQDAARPHLEALAALPDLQVARSHERNAKAVDAARERVAQLALADRVYAVLRGSATEQAKGLRLSEVVGPAGVGILERASNTSLAEPLPAIFSRDGYRAAVRTRVRDIVKVFAGEEEWVMGDRTSGIGRTPTDTLVTEIQRRYFAEFKALWDGVLRDIRVRKPMDVNTANAMARTLSQPDSPLKKLVVAIDQQTRLSGNDGKDTLIDAAKSQARDKLKDSVNNATGNVFGGKAGDVAAAATAGPGLASMEAELDEYFAGLRRLAGDGKAAEIDAALQVLTELSTELTKMQGAVGGAGLKAVPPELTALRGRAERFAPPVSTAILSLIDFGEREAAGGVKKELKAGLGGAAAMCVRAVPGRYPFARNSNRDMAVQDFINVFKSGGELDAFYSANLAPFVDKSGQTWRLKASGGGAPPISAATLRQFQDAEAIRAAFLGGGASPAVNVTVLATAVDGKVALVYDGKSYELGSGGAGARLSWPAQSSAKLLYKDQVVTAAEGPWALFRLIDKGIVDPGSAGEKLRVTYAAPGGGRIVLEVRAESAAFNPFRLRELESFNCPTE